METVLKKPPIEEQVFEFVSVDKAALGRKLDVEGHIAFLILPKRRTPGKSTPWVWYAPTLPGLPGASEKWMFDQFLKAGIAIAGVDVGESYGNPNGRAIYSALYKELTKEHGLSKKACLLARSRGGLMLYNWAVENPMSVACIAGIYPVCNLSSYPGLKRACEAYGLSEAALAGQLAKHNPIDRLSSLAKAGVHIFHIHGDSDNVVPLEQNSAEIHRKYIRLGGKMQLIVAAGQGHSMWSGFFNCQELVDFVIAEATEGNESTGNSEINN